MKVRPSILLMIAVAGIISISSCTRTYICHCEISYTGIPGLPDSVAKEFDITDTKSNAKSQCTAQSSTVTKNGVTSTENCYLY